MKQYRLRDGSVWDAQTLSDKLGCSKSCAGQRLRAHDDPKKIFAPIGEALKIKYKKKSYELTKDGKVAFTGSACDIAVKYSLCESTVYSRLRKGDRTVETVCKKPNSSMATNTRTATPPIKVNALIKGRNFFDPLSRLLLKTI
mgnify:FL=1